MIGLRVTCAVARHVMCIWDPLWKQKIAKLIIKTELCIRDMDDDKAFLYPFKAGWQWGKVGLKLCKARETEDTDLALQERTSRILACIMNSVRTKEHRQTTSPQTGY